MIDSVDTLPPIEVAAGPFDLRPQGVPIESPLMLPPISNLHRVDLQPGDVLIATVQEGMPASIREGMRKNLQAAFPNHRVVVIHAHGVQLTVWNEAATPLIEIMARGIAELLEKVERLERAVIEDEAPALDLEGRPIPPERDPGQPL